MCPVVGGCEWLVIFCVGVLIYAFPVVFGVVVLIYLATIHKAVKAVQQRLDRLEQNLTK